MNTNKINVTKRRNSSIMKIAAVMALAISAQLTANLAYAGAGWGDNIDVTGQPIKVPTFYANSPAGLKPNKDPNAVPSVIDPATGLLVVPPVDTGTPLRKFVDSLPSILSPNLAPSTTANTCGALTAGNCNGQYMPLGVAEKWVDANGNVTNDDYYEIGIVEYTERMHSDLFKATRLRGYVQLSTVKTPGKQIPLTYPDGTPIYKWKKDPATGVWAQSLEQVTAVDTPHYLGPVILAVSGVPVRIKFTNYLPFGAMKGAKSFIPVDKTITGAGETYGGIDGTVTLPDGTTAPGVVHEMLQNRTAIHWHGGDSPWISDGTPHQWFAPAGEVDYYANGLGKGVSAQNVPDMPDPGPGSMTMFFPNDMSGRLMWYHEHVSGLTRLNAYSGIAAGYLLIDPTEWGLAGAGVLPAEQIPLVIQDKTFVPKNIAQQDAKWNKDSLGQTVDVWGTEGDLWFPHVYETNQDPNSFDGTNPVGRWDWGPWFWPIFPAQYSLPSGAYDDVSTTPEAFMDTGMVNGTAYPTITVDPKAYRFRILNGANDRFINLSFFQAIDSVGKLCNLNATPAQIAAGTHTNNPIAEASGVKCTEVKLVPAVPTATFPPTWPTDGRFGGVPDPATSGPDIIHIGTEGGIMPHPALIPAHPIAYEMNRRSITVLNILDRALLLGGAERADVVVDFSQFAGQTLILYNDAPAPVPANDPRIDYFTGMEDFSGSGGSFGTLPGYGPNTRTLMQIVVRNTTPAPAFLPKAPGYMSMDAAAVDPGITPADAQKFAAFDVAMAAVYGATQSRPIVPQPEYNQAFGTNDAQNLARIYTGSITAPTFDFTPTGVRQPVRSVGLVGGGTGYRAAPIVEIVGGGIDLSPAGIAAGNRAAVVVAEVDNIATPYIPPNPALGTPAIPAHIPTYKLTGLRLMDPGFGYVAAPQVLFKPVNGGVGAVASVQLQTTISLQIKSKAIHELFEPVYGRMNAILAMELPFTSALIQTTIPLNYIDPVTEILGEGEIQIWKITHNGVDSHPVHFHLVNVQVLNRIGWDGTVKPIQPYEFGWKETVLMNPLEDIVVAVKAKRPVVPFGQPKSQRLMDPTQPVGSMLGFSQVNPFTNIAMVVANAVKNYDNEYVWHCHILGHEENDFMRPVTFNPIVIVPDAPTNLSMETAGVVSWNDPTPLGGVDLAGVPTAGTVLGSTNPISNPKNEIKFVVEKSTDGLLWAVAGETLANATSWTDPAYVEGNQYRVIANNCATHVFATNTCTGNSAPSSVLAVSSVVAAPTPLPLAIATNGLTANVNWTDNATNETAYRVEVAMVSANGAVGTYTQLTNIPRTGAQTTGTGAMVHSAITALGKHYRYRVSALNGTISSLAIVFDVDLTAPPQPIAPTASEVFLQLDAINSRISVSWLDNATDESGYVIEQSMDRGAWSPFLLLNTAIPGSNTRPNVFADVVSGHSYSYRIASYKSNPWQRTNSTWLASGELSVGLPAAPVLPTTVIAANGLSATLSWTDKSNNEDSFLVQVSTDNGLTYTTATNGTIVRTGAAQSYAKDVTVSYNAVTLPGTSYKYRVKAVNWLGSSAAISFNVVTAPSAPTVLLTTLNYQAATGLRTNVSWLDNSNNETSYVVETSTDGGVTFVQAVALDRTGALGTTTGTRPLVSVPVLAGQRYTFRVKAVRTNFGVTAGSAYLSSAVNVVDTTLPAAPTGLPTVIAATGLSATLSWTDNANNETNYLVETSTNNGVTYGSPTTVTRSGAVVAATGGVVTPPNKVTVPGTKYTYRITARNLAGSSAPITVVADLSPPATPLAPTAVTSVLDNTGTLASVSWTDNSNNETAYRVEVAVALGASSATPFGAYVAQPTLLIPNGTSTGTRVSMNVAVAPNNRYKFRISAVNTRYGLTKYSNLLTSGVLDTRIPNAPTGLSAIPSVVGVGAAQVALSWTDNSAIETSFTVQRAVITNGVVGVYSSLLPAIARGGVETTGFGAVGFTDTTVVLGTSYSYKVFASNANGDSGVSNVVTADLTLPVAPTIQSVTPELTGVAVRWLDNSANESGFLVEISTDAGLNWSTVETTVPGVQISHAPLTQPGTYTFRVSAVNQWGVPATSTLLPITLSQPVAPNLQLDTLAPLDATGVNLIWNAVANAIAYQVEVSSTGVNGTWTAEPATTATTLHLPVLTAGVYNYRVTALTAVTAIKSTASVENVVVDLSMPATPNLSQVTDTTGTGVDLSWAAVPGATGYLVEESATGTAPWTLVETTASNVFTSHAPVTTPGIYSYQVTALTPVTGINSLPSNLVTVNLTTPAAPTQFVARLVGTGINAAVDLTWVDNATNESGYDIQVDNGNGWISKAIVAAGASGTMTWRDTDTIPGIRAYRVIALTPVIAITSLPSNTDSVNYNGTAPLELNSVTVGSITVQSVVLNWTDPAGNNEGGYRIYRFDPVSNIESILIEVPVHVMTYTDTTAAAGITYTYRVTAVNPWGETAGKTVVADLAAPVAPSLLAAAIVLDGGGAPSTYEVTWQDNSTNEAYFILEYSADGGNTWGGVNVPPSRTNHLLNATPFMGLTTEAGLPYGVGTGVTGLSIRVYAVNSVGVASPVTATVILAP